MIVYVNGNDRIAASDLGCHQSGQTNASDPKHDNAVARVWDHRVEHRAGASLDAASEWADTIKWCIAPNFHDEALIGNRMCSEGRLLEECAVNRQAVFAHERGAVRSGAAHLQLG